MRLGNRFRFSVLTGFTLLLMGMLPASGGADSPPIEPRNGSDVPVVLILLDELPNTNLMTPDGAAIDSRRYPRIADFAAGSTWYRDNVAGGDFTAWAVPSILTGNLSNEQTMPTSAAQPLNLFTQMGPGRQVHSLEEVTELCPVEICPDGRQGEYPEETTADGLVRAKYRPFSMDEVRDWIAGIPAGGSTLSFIHVKSPHLPLRYLPGGQKYPGTALQMPNDMSSRWWTADDAAISFVQQRHLMQTGFADRLVGEILDKIKSNGDYDEAMIVLTADHGISFDRLDLRRDVSATNVGATVNPPLIIKYPGQSQAVVSTASTQSIDILPTIAEQLGAEIADTMGQPVSDAQPGRVMTVSKDLMENIQVTAEQVRKDRKAALAAQVKRLGTRGLWKLGPRNDLIGRRPAPRPGKFKGRFFLDSPGQLRRADGTRSTVPSLVAGSFGWVPPNTVIALAWNGKIVATTRAFRYRNRIRFGAMVPPAVMKPGRNKIAMYVVGKSGLRKIPRG